MATCRQPRPKRLTPVQPQAVSRQPVPVIKVENIKKTYYMGETKVRALRGVSLEVQRGEFVAIIGTSGSGKSTMMNILGCLDRPTRGTYMLAGIDVGDAAERLARHLRNPLIGFIFQGFNLLPRTTALENGELPLQYRGSAGRARAQARARRSSWWGWRDAQHRPTSFRAGSSSASPSPARSSPIRRSSWPTSRRATSTRAPASRSWPILQPLNHAGSPLSW